MHIREMLLKDFMQGLLTEAKLNPNSLATRMGNRSLQSTVERITAGKTTSPRISTIAAIAEFFRVPTSAFFDAAVADQVASSRGWGSAPTAEEDSPAYGRASANVSPIPAALRPGIQELAQMMAFALQPHDLSARKAAASLMADLALHPENGAATAAHLARLLGEQGNGLPPGSIRSLGNGN